MVEEGSVCVRVCVCACVRVCACAQQESRCNRPTARLRPSVSLMSFSLSLCLSDWFDCLSVCVSHCSSVSDGWSSGQHRSMRERWPSGILKGHFSQTTKSRMFPFTSCDASTWTWFWFNLPSFSLSDVCFHPSWTDVERNVFFVLPALNIIPTEQMVSM